MLRYFLFGAPRIEYRGQDVSPGRRKALALLIYLAVTERPQERETLLALLWPELDDKSARNNLRRDLSLLRGVLGDGLLVTSGQQISLGPDMDVWVDVAAFKAQLAAAAGLPPDSRPAIQALEAAAALAAGDFLSGFGLPDCPMFEEWLFFQREELRQQLAAAAQRLASWYGERADYGPAITYARRWLSLDLLHEPAQRELMRLYAWSGQTSAALRLYAESERLLERELGVEPEEETAELHQAIKARRLPAPGPVTGADVIPPGHRPIDLSSSAVAAAGPIDNLPRPPGFVGRQHDLADVLRRLTDPGCRLLTLVGPGGIGKTRLALEAARIVVEQWAGEVQIRDGILFVSLASVTTLAGLVAALASAAGFAFYPNVPPVRQILDYFRAKRMLVVLDNFEQLIDETPFVGELLAAAPHLRLLVSSRQALNLREEWFHPIDGLSFPADAHGIRSVADLARFDAVRLFEQHARRVRSDFVLSRERDVVVRLCQLVDGMPLAIELAASWLKALSTERVVEALERSLDILSTRDRAIPERHRSMRAVLDESWQLLSRDEQLQFARLSVFAGDFTAEAAGAIGGVALDALLSLVEKSLLRRAADGRFQMHELLRQYAAERLAAHPEEEVAARGRHSAYYLDLLTGLEPDLLGRHQPTALAAIDAESGNVRAAWEQAVAAQDIIAVDHAIDALYEFFSLGCRYHEGEEVFSLATAMLAARLDEGAQAARAHVRAAGRQGAFAYFLGMYDLVRERLGACLRAAQSLGLSREEAFALDLLGQLAAWQGDYRQAMELLEQSLAISRAADDTQQMIGVLPKLATILWDRGEFAEVLRLSAESLALSQRIGRPDCIAYALDGLAIASLCLGDYDAAEEYYRQTLAVFEGIRHQLGIALALGGVGLIHWSRGGARVHDAIPYFERSLELIRMTGHRRHMMDRMNDLARAWTDLGAYGRALAYGREALELSRELGSPVYVANALCCLGKTMIEMGDGAAASRFLHEAARVSTQHGLALVFAETLLYSIELLARDDPQSPGGVGVERARAALALAEAALRLPMWHVMRERVQHLKVGLEARLPAGTAIAVPYPATMEEAVALIERWLAPPGQPDAAG